MKLAFWLTLIYNEIKMIPGTTTSADALLSLGSGGYADSVFQYAAREIYGVDIDVVSCRRRDNRERVLA
jgi:hypothetical protein